MDTVSTKIPFSTTVTSQHIDDYLRKKYDRPKNNSSPDGQIDGAEGDKMWKDGWDKVIAKYMGAPSAKDFESAVAIARAIESKSNYSDRHSNMYIDSFSSWYIKNFDLQPTDNDIDLSEQIIAKKERPEEWMSDTKPLQQYEGKTDEELKSIARLEKRKKELGSNPIPFSPIITAQKIANYLLDNFDKLGNSTSNNGVIDDGSEYSRMESTGWRNILTDYPDRIRVIDYGRDITTIDPLEFAKWYIKKFDLNGDGCLDIDEQIAAQDSNKPWMVKADGIDKYSAYKEQLKMFAEADADGDGLIEKDNGEFGKLLRLYEEKYPSENSREKNAIWYQKWGNQWVWDKSFVGKNALAQFEKDTNIYFQTAAKDYPATKSEMIDSYEIDDVGFNIYIDGKLKFSWAPGELFRIR